MRSHPSSCGYVQAVTIDWRTAWGEVDRRHVEAKDSQGAIVELFELYARLSADARAAANAALFDALHEDDETRRHDALAMINQFKLREAIPHMRELAARLQLADSAGAPFELAKVQRFLQKLQALR
jgi:hypothetical protein